MFDEFYGFTGRPFQLTPDPAFFFESVTHRKALSYLGYGLQQGEGFIVITGEVGAGKSTLVAHLCEMIDPEQLTIAQIVTSRLNEEEIVHVVATAFGLSVAGHDKASALSAIEGFLHEEAREGRRCLLVLDEAQNLAVEALEELRMLSNFQLGNHPLLQTLLLGQPEFRRTLQQHEGLEQLRQRVIATHHLAPMQRNEVRPYIEHRLTKVGWTGSPAIDVDVFPSLFDASGGIPRRLNQIAHRLFLLAAVEERARIDAGMVAKVMRELAGDNGQTETTPAAEPLAAAAPAPAPASAPAQPRASESHEASAPPQQETAPAPAPAPSQRPEPTQRRAEPQRATNDAHPAVARAAVAGMSRSAVQALLAERDSQIAELQQAVIEVADALEQQALESGANGELEARISRIEKQLTEQEHTLRHTLTMLIEWIEGDRPIAA